jgi:exonuclease III
MKILLLNIRHGGGRRAQNLLDWTLSAAPDIVVLPEWRNNAIGQAILEAFESEGFNVATASRQSASANGLFIAAKQSFESKRITTSNSQKGELLVVEIPHVVRLLAGYFPLEKLKEPFFRICVDEAKRAHDVPFLLVGDLNTGSNDLDVEGNGMRFHCADSFNALATQAGLIDLWRATNGNNQEWTWRSRVNGFRIDHAFANKPFIDQFGPIRCYYDHAPRESKITDHSALFVEFY